MFSFVAAAYSHDNIHVIHCLHLFFLLLAVVQSVYIHVLYMHTVNIHCMHVQLTDSNWYNIVKYTCTLQEKQPIYTVESTTYWAVNVNSIIHIH